MQGMTNNSQWVVIIKSCSNIPQSKCFHLTCSPVPLILRLTQGRSRSVCTPGRAPGLRQRYPRSTWRTDDLWKCQTPRSAAPRPSYRPGAAERQNETRQRGQDRSIRESYAGVLKKAHIWDKEVQAKVWLKMCVYDSESIRCVAANSIYVSSTITPQPNQRVDAWKKELDVY